MKKIIVIIIFVLLVGFGIKYFKDDFIGAENQSPAEQEVIEDVDSKETKVFNTKVTELGLNINKLGGYLELSPDNKYLFFGGVFEEGEKFENKIFAADLSSGRIWALPGSPIGEASMNGLIATAEMDTIYINRLSDGTYDEYTDSNMTLSGSFSPDGKKFVYNSTKGIRLIDLQTKTITEISQNRYDGAFAWYADSNRVLGFRENPLDNVFEAGKGRILAIWDLSKKSYTDVPVDMPSSVLRRVRWMDEQAIALVNAGWDDGSFDYIVDLERNFVIDLGDTSGMFAFGGVALDADADYIAMVGAETNGPGELEPLSVVKLVDERGTVLGRKGFDDNYSREYAQVIDNHTIMYLRKGSFENKSTDVIWFDFNVGQEKVLYTMTDWAYNLRVTKDKKSWILAGQDSIIMKDI